MSATVNFSADSTYSLRVNAQENLLPYIETYLEGTQLVIRIKNHYSLGAHDPIIFMITAPDVKEFDISGSGNIEIDSLSAASLKATISGSGSGSVKHL